MRTLRLVTAAALVLLTGGGVSLSAGASTPTPCGGNTALAGNGWLATNPGVSKITVARAVTYAPERLFVTDGSTLRRTDDAGCTWRTASLPAVTVAGVSALAESMRITDIATPSSSTSASYVYVAGQVSVTDALPVSLPAQPVVFSSADSGSTWKSSSNGLPSVGTIAELTAADQAPQNLLALVTGAGSSSGVYVSSDGGTTWALRNKDTTVSHLRVSPAVLNQIYGIRAGAGMVVSNDGGATFAPLQPNGPDVKSFAANSGNGFVQLARGHAGSGRYDVSLDGARSWTQHLAPEDADSVAMAPIAPVLAVYDQQRLSVEQLVGRAVIHTALTPAVGAPLAGTVQASAPTGVGLALTGISPDGSRVLRTVYDMFTRKVVPPSLTPIHLLPQTTVKQFPSTLTSSVSKVSIPAGASRDVPYQLLLPRTPSPVDLMFLVDTTNSTDQTIDGVRQGLQSVANDLRSTGLDVQFGVGDFKDYPGWAGGEGPDTDYPYKLRRRIGPADATLAHALSTLKAADGGDVPESDLTALYQSTTGVGQLAADVYGDAPGKRYVVAPGQQAGYRPNSLRLAFLATDEPFHDPSDGSISPSWATTINALVGHGVHQIGLAVESTDGAGNPEPGVFDSLHDERRMAKATGAVAPRGGVDCDGDGTTDIPAGSPLVCTISKPSDQRIKVPVGNGQVVVGKAPAAVHLAPLLVQLAESIPDYRAVGLQITGAPAGLARVVSNPGAPVVNVRADNTLGYVVRYTCPKKTTGHAWPLTLTAMTAGRSLSSTNTTVVCGAVPKVPAAAVVPPAAAAVVTAGVAPGAPPNPPTNVNTNVNPNPAVNPNAGFAQQDEEQPQLALADADQGPADDTTLAMSRRSSDSEAAWMLAAAGLMTAGAAGYATRTRWRTARQFH
jgi:hypothetical protein